MDLYSVYKDCIVNTVEAEFTMGDPCDICRDVRTCEAIKYIMDNGTHEDFNCCHCGNPLDSLYIYLMLKLREKKLLPQNHKFKCCICDAQRIDKLSGDPDDENKANY